MVSPYCISKVTASLKKQSHLSNKRLQLNESQRLATNAEQRGKNVNSGTRSSFHHSVMFCFADLSLNNSCWSRGSVHPRSDKALCVCLGTWACLRPWTQSPAGECVLPWIFWRRTDGCSTHQHDILQQSQILTSVVVATDVPHVSGREESLARRAVFQSSPSSSTTLALTISFYVSHLDLGSLLSFISHVFILALRFSSLPLPWSCIIHQTPAYKVHFAST